MTSDISGISGYPTSKVPAQLVQSIKHSTGDYMSGHRTISKIRIKNLGKRRDRSMINSKRGMNNSPIHISPDSLNNKSRVNAKAQLRSRNTTEEDGN
jgi:hypothetical protein